MTFDKKEFFGEFIGTAILVFFGCGSVASAILFGSFEGLFQIAMVWTIGVSIAIYASRSYSGAHLNPAVSIAMVITKNLPSNKLPLYIGAQFLGAFFAAGVLYALFSEQIEFFEAQMGIVRGSANSIVSGSMFGEYFPNPGFADRFGEVEVPQAMLVEGLGTFILVYAIYWVTKTDKLHNIAPVLIGATVGALICLLAPVTQGGFNPARDFGPRLFAYFAGWGDAAFPSATFSFFTVYILAPIIGGAAAAFAHRTFHRAG